MGNKDVNGQISETPRADAADVPIEAVEVEIIDEEAAEEGVNPSPDATTRLAEELQQIRDQLLRTVAEYQNYRRRTEREQARWSRNAQITVIKAMLSVLDDFRRSLEASVQVEEQETPGPAYQALKTGVDLVYKKFDDALAGFGVVAIEALGTPFNENVHEAMMQMPAPEGLEPGDVVEEIERGYRLGDQVLRHSKVIVAS